MSSNSNTSHPRQSGLIATTLTPIECNINIGFRQEQVSAGGNQDIPDAIGKNLWPNGAVELENHGGVISGEGISEVKG